MDAAKAVFALAAVLGAGVWVLAQQPDGEDGADPDRPVHLAGRFDDAEYLRRRDEFIALLRGVDPARPADPESRIRAIALADAQRDALARRAARGDAAAQALVVPSWVPLGPSPIPNGQTQTTSSPVSGRVTAIEIDPADANRVYVGTAQGGVYRSLDGGATWTPIFDGAVSLAIGALALDTANGWLWVGTGEANLSADSFAGVGLYRVESVNTSPTLVGPINPIRNYTDADGSTPRSAGFFSGRSISRIVRVPNDAGTLFVGVTGGVIGVGGNPPLGNSLPPLAMRGLVRISNATAAPASITGTRLTVSNNPLGGPTGSLCFDSPCTVNRNVNDIAPDPQDPSGNTMVVWLNGTAAAGDGGIYRSINAMSPTPTFAQTLITAATSTGNARGALRAYARSGTTTIYVASGEPSTGTICNSSSNNGALRRSDDGGQTWSTVLSGGGGFCGGQCFYNIGFDVVAGVATASDKLLLGGNVRSTSCAKLEGTSIDGGASSFANTDVGLHADTHVIRVAPSNALVVYRGDDGGIWKSSDGGTTWTSLNNATFSATQFESIALHPNDARFTIGGTQDNGTEKLVSGPTWTRSDAGDGGYSAIDQNATNTTTAVLYHTYFNQAGAQIGYARSDDAGGTWNFLGCFNALTVNGISCDLSVAVNFYAPVALGPGNPNTVYLGTDRLLRSTDKGANNTTVSQAPLVSGIPISAIAIAPQDDNYRVVGNDDGSLWFTTTGSSTLTRLDPVGVGSVIPDFYVARIVFDPLDKNTVYVTLGNFAGNTNPAGSHVWKIGNLGGAPTLTAVNGTGANVLPDVPVNAFAIEPTLPTRLYAGTDIGVFASVDGGANWSPYGAGLPRIAVFDMAVQKTTGVLRIATHGRGIWEIASAELLFKDGFE